MRTKTPKPDKTQRLNGEEIPPKQEPEVMTFDPLVVSGLYDMLGSIEGIVFSRAFNIPADISKQVFSYSPEEKKALEGPTVRVLNKYVAEWMLKYKDELALLTLLISLTIAKANIAMMMAKQRTIEVKAAEPVAEPEKKEEAKVH